MNFIFVTAIFVFVQPALTLAKPTASTAAQTETKVTTPEEISKYDPEGFCAKAENGEVPGIAFKFFDHSWRNDEWETSKKRLIAKCLNWNKNKQDSQTISDLIQERNVFGYLSMNARDKMVDATIQRLGQARNQGSTPLCYGNAFADVASYHSGRKVSAFSVAIRGFHQLGGSDAFWAGLKNSKGRYSNGLHLVPTAKGVLHGRLCADDQLRSSPGFTGEDLVQIWDTYQNKYRPYNGPQAPVVLYNQIQKYLSLMAPSLSASDFISHISRYKPMDIAFGEWFDRQCNISLKGGSPQIVVKETNIQQVLDEALDSGTIPVINYNAKVIQPPGGPHASSVVGKATIEGVSYYLLRNTWGADCGIYSAAVASRCRLGHFWLTEPEIKDNTRQVVYIKGLR